MKTHTTAFVTIVLAAGLLLAAPVFAQNTSTISIADLQALIEELKTQIETLQARVVELEGELPAATTAEEPTETRKEIHITKVLQQGAIGDEVEELQRFLKNIPGIYPEGLVTGYFGPLTVAAVKRFQARQDIVSSGSVLTTGYGQVGPRTLLRINTLITQGAGASGVIPSGLLTAPGIQDKLPTTTAVATVIPPVTTSISTLPATTSTAPVVTTTPPVATTTEPAPVPAPAPAPYSGTPAPATTVTITTTSTTTATTTDTTPPTISSITVTNITETSSTVSWTTNESSDSKVEYGLTTDYSSQFTNTYFVTNHSMIVSGLNADTTYYFRVISKDVAGNSTTSGGYVFTTLSIPDPLADTTSPVISSITVTNITETSATVTWTTDESATSGVAYAFASPVPGNASSVLNATDVTSHSITLSNLMGGYTYYYTVASTDAAGNTAVSSEQSFVTLITLPPAPGIPRGSTSVSTGASSTYSVLVYGDPDGDKVKAIFDWGDNTTFEFPSFGYFSVTGGLTSDATKTWTNVGTYSVRAKIKDLNGLESEWGDTLTVIVSAPSSFDNSEQNLASLLGTLSSALKNLQQLLK